MKLKDVLKAIPEQQLNKVVINEIPLTEYDVLDADFISLYEVPVFSYQLEYTDEVEQVELSAIKIETLWS